MNARPIGCALLAILAGSCSKPGFGSPPDADDAADATDTATEHDGQSDADADEVQTGACLARDDDNAVECSPSLRGECLPDLDGSRVFYGEGSECPDVAPPYTWDGVGDCDADVNGDSRVDFMDVGRVTDCITTGEGCDSTDINEDGRTDPWDACIAACVLGSFSSCCENPRCGACLSEGARGLCQVTDMCGGTAPANLTPCPECACDADVDANGVVNATDPLFTSNCARGIGAHDCSKADVNCDGFVNACDVEAVSCRWPRGGPECCLRRCDG